MLTQVKLDQMEVEAEAKWEKGWDKFMQQFISQPANSPAAIGQMMDIQPPVIQPLKAG
jgi:hypothetical protein